jgi:hypothetical protein
MWEEQGIVVDFAVLKHMLEGVRRKFEPQECFHIGDTDIDRRYAVLAGFVFLPVATTTGEPWMLNGADGLSS